MRILLFIQRTLLRKRRSSGTHRAFQVTRAARTINSDQDLKDIWDKLIDEYFPNRQDLKLYIVKWGRSQKRTLGSCNISKGRVNIAREFDCPTNFHWAEPILYHELCHAVIGQNVPRFRRRRIWHGEEFKALEKLHPLIPPLKIWIKSVGWRDCH